MSQLSSSRGREGLCSSYVTPRSVGLPPHPTGVRETQDGRPRGAKENGSGLSRDTQQDATAQAMLSCPAEPRMAREVNMWPQQSHPSPSATQQGSRAETVGKEVGVGDERVDRKHWDAPWGRRCLRRLHSRFSLGHCKSARPCRAKWPTLPPPPESPLWEHWGRPSLGGETKTY